jgi:hypothetical protein
MEETTKRKNNKTKTEVVVDSFLWRLANKRHSASIMIAILVVTYLAGILTVLVAF